MKAKLIIVLIIVLFVSCQNNDDIQNNENQTETINGSWNLKLVYGGFLPVNIEYDTGDVKWTFNEAEGNVVIENNIITTGPEDIYAGLESGTYNYEIQTINDVERLYVDGLLIGVILMNEDSLELDNGLAADGYVSKYER